MSRMPVSGLASRLMPSLTILSASMSRPESVSSSTATLGWSIAICRISSRFFSPPARWLGPRNVQGLRWVVLAARRSTVDVAFVEALFDGPRLPPSCRGFTEGLERLARAVDGLERRAYEVGDAGTRDRNRVLES